MKRGLLIICVLLLSTISTLKAQDYKADFKEIQQEFAERLQITSAHLNQHLDKYPYSPYCDEIRLMEGVLQTEKGKYKQASRTFANVNTKNLSRETQPMLYFYWGYALIQQKQYDKALAHFNHLKNRTSQYTPHARYYAGYCHYCKEEFPQAMAEFLSIEHLGGYKQIAPYYIVQIYYAQRKYKEVYERAEELLQTYPNNEHNNELHRMLGEIYYQDSAYTKSIEHLSAYQSKCQELKKEVLRNDLYLLGMAQYYTKDYDLAIQNLKLVKQLNDSISENTCLHLGHCYLRINDLEKAKLSYSAAMRFNINATLREEAMYNYVQITYLQGSALGESITAFHDFLREYPNTQYANKIYALMGDMYMTSKNYLAALNALSEIKSPDAKLQNTMQYLRYQMGVDAFLQNKMQNAVKWMDQVISNEANQSEYKTEAYYIRAESNYRLHRYDECIKDLKAYESQGNILRSNNRNMAMYLKAYAYFNQGNLKDAEGVFQQYLTSTDTKNATYTDALNRLADCHFSKREFEKAVDLYQQVADRGGAGSDYALYQKGYALGLLHRYADKIQTMKLISQQHPRSDYADDALYETARAQLQLNKNEEAIETYQTILKKYPNSNKAAKSALELGMTYRTLKQYDNAIAAFKSTINKHAGTEEAYAALEGLEQVYVETNKISDYLAYTKTLSNINMQAVTSEDSLVYVTAELQYMMGNYEQAAAGLTTYLTSFCPGGRYCMSAQYYAANSFYRLKQYDNAMDQYRALTELAGNPYMEEACMRVAEISYDKQDYQTALNYFQRMKEVASSLANQTTAQLGVLRCCYNIEDRPGTIEAATGLLAFETLATEIRQEALYCRAKAHIAEKQYGLAVVDLTPLCKEVRTARGAEAKYELANAFFLLGALDTAEQEIMTFTQMQTTQQYWLAKSLILLADINVQRQDLFQAKQYLLALQSNYRLEDEIPNIINEKLQQIEELEKLNEDTETQTEEETL